MKKNISWEESDLYLILHHHDEHIHDKLGLCHRIHLIDSGTMLELHDKRDGAVPQHYSARSGNSVPRRTTRISGFTRTIIPLKSFEGWWTWFRQRNSNRSIFVLSDVSREFVEQNASYLIDESDDICFSS